MQLYLFFHLQNLLTGSYPLQDGGLLVFWCKSQAQTVLAPLANFFAAFCTDAVDRRRGNFPMKRIHALQCGDGKR